MDYNFKVGIKQMQRSSFHAKNLNINQMRQTSYERGFDYVSCHEKIPL